MNNKKVVIVAAGLGTRLGDITKYIPKVLVNSGKLPILVEQFKMWKHFSTDITMIVHSKFVPIIQAYSDLYAKNEGINVTIKTVDEPLGSAYAISSALGNEYINSKILFTWCDLCPSSADDVKNINGLTEVYEGINLIITCNNGANRYKYDKQSKTLKKDPAQQGDVIGIYYVDRYKNFLFSEGEDFADVLYQFGEFDQYVVNDIIDIGDTPKLQKVLEERNDGAREFNSVLLNGNLVLKKSTAKQGDRLIAREINWYHTLAMYGDSSLVPNTYFSLDNNDMSFVMERIDGMPLWAMFVDPAVSPEDKIDLVKKAVENIKKLHSMATFKALEHDIRNDVFNESFDKIKNRCSEIEDVLRYFNSDTIKQVNGVEIIDFSTALATVYAKLASYYESNREYHLIHGDCQFSNTLIKNDGELVLIDPRGYFGDTPNHGPVEYDLAKILYSVSGYDTFNYSMNFCIESLTSDSIEFKIKDDYIFGEKALPGIKEIFDNEIVWCWLVVIWLGLAQYIKNNPLKCAAAYYHGLYIATLLLNKGIK